jgi:hypothetical protein
MTTNKYFNSIGVCSEQNLLESLWTESIQIYGQDLFYIPRTLVNSDLVLGSDYLTNFTQGSAPLEMWIENVDGFSGDGDFFSKFGIEIKDSVTLVCGRERFAKVIGEKFGLTRPMEGDLLFFPPSNGLFQIKFVEHENPFYQLGKLYVYKLTCELFAYGQEKLATDIPEVDQLEEDLNDISNHDEDGFATNDDLQAEDTV